MVWRKVVIFAVTGYFIFITTLAGLSPVTARAHELYLSSQGIDRFLLSITPMSYLIFGIGLGLGWLSYAGILTYRALQGGDAYPKAPGSDPGLEVKSQF